MLKQKKSNDKNVQKIDDIILNSFLIRKGDESLAGFGTDVWKVYCAGDLKLVCYLNSEKQLYFPAPISYDNLSMLTKFIESYNLGNIVSKAV